MNPIHVDAVSKRYRIGSPDRSLRATLAGIPDAVLGRRRSEIRYSADLWALRNVSFTVAEGEALGIIGRNGAGKTTVLKLLSGITRPTAGHISIQGRVAALIELGAGFHPELTGLENVYLYGTILGLSRRELAERLDRIVDFAELHAFMDTPVKRYSAGMYARLAFSVAAHVNPDVLLVDEVLSVGDQAFGNKCLDFLHSFVRSGKNTIFISHDTYAVEQLCDRLIWLDGGKIVTQGNPGEVLGAYLDQVDDKPGDPGEYQYHEKVDGNLHILRSVITDGEGLERDVYCTGDDIVINIDYRTDRVLERPHFCIWISDGPAPKPLFGANMIVDGGAPELLYKTGTVRCTFRSVPLMPRTYYVWLEVYGSDRSEILFQWQRIHSFRIVDNQLLERVAGRRGAVRFVKAHGPVKVPYEWSLPDNRIGASDGCRALP